MYFESRKYTSAAIKNITVNAITRHMVQARSADYQQVVILAHLAAFLRRLGFLCFWPKFCLRLFGGSFNWNFLRGIERLRRRLNRIKAQKQTSDLGGQGFESSPARHFSLCNPRNGLASKRAGANIVVFRRNDLGLVCGLTLWLRNESL